MSRYIKNPLITPFSLLCPEISRNSKNHHLSLYKGQVWREKSYPELCDNNILKIIYGRTNMTEDKMEKNGELYVPPTPGIGFINDDFTQIPWNSEILQSFAEMTRITHITFLFHDPINYGELGSAYDDLLFGIRVGNVKCHFGDEFAENCGGVWCVRPNQYKCVTLHSHSSLYIWTKEGLKI